MSDKPNNPLNFWQELKRRKVIRVIVIYTAAALAILEAVDIIFPRMGFPDWTITFVIFLLVIGFVITVILSWIYDVTPEGIEKTKPVHEITEKVTEKPLTVNAWKIATYISVVVIIGLIIFNIFGRRGKVEDLVILDKSIAVLPFRSLSEDPEKQYLADGAMDAILLHLSKIKDLRVMARTSVEQYRETDKTATAICQELDVAFLLEGSFQKYGDQARLIVQLIEPGKEGHIWAKEYDRNWTDIFSVQSEVAQSIARELQAVITPVEKQLIEKVPTTNLTAYDFYQRGSEGLWKFFLMRNREVLDRATDLFNKALEYDSTFAQVYTGLAFTKLMKSFPNIIGAFLTSDTYVEGDFLDTVVILSDIALSYDDQLAEAYTLKGYYYTIKGLKEKAIKELNNAIKFNPNDWIAYLVTGILYCDYDLVKGLENLHLAVSINRGSELPELLRYTGIVYINAGFTEKGNLYIQEALKLDDDSIAYYRVLSFAETSRGDYEKAIEFIEKIYTEDIKDPNILWALGYNYMFNGQFEEALRYYAIFYETLKSIDQLSVNNMHRIAYVYWQKGFREEAEYYFNEQIKYSNRDNELGQLMSQLLYTYYDLAGTYSFRGEKKKAYENLRIFNQRQIELRWMVTLIKNDPLFDSIRGEPEFQQIIKDVEAKYQTEHERVRQWLEENDML